MGDVWKLPVRNKTLKSVVKWFWRDFYSPVVCGSKASRHDVQGDEKSAVPLRQKGFDTAFSSFSPIPVEITTSSLLPCLFPFILQMFGLFREVQVPYFCSPERRKRSSEGGAGIQWNAAGYPSTGEGSSTTVISDGQAAELRSNLRAALRACFLQAGRKVQRDRTSILSTAIALASSSLCTLSHFWISEGRLCCLNISLGRRRTCYILKWDVVHRKWASQSKPVQW